MVGRRPLRYGLPRMIASGGARSVVRQRRRESRCMRPAA